MARAFAFGSAKGSLLKRVLLCAAIGAALSAPAVSAATEKPAKVYPGPGYGDRSDASGAEYLRKFAQCVVDVAPEPAARLLTKRPRSSQEEYAMRHISGVSNKCFPNGIESLRYGTIEMRGFIAEILYLKDFPTDPDFSLLNHAEVKWPAEWMEETNQVQNLLPIYMMQFGSCVAASDPSGVAALLRTGVRSKEERAVIQRLNPALGACLDSGRTFKLDAAMLRALSAQGLQRSANEWQATTVAANDLQKATN